MSVCTNIQCNTKYTQKNTLNFWFLFFVLYLILCLRLLTSSICFLSFVTSCDVLRTRKHRIPFFSVYEICTCRDKNNIQLNVSTSTVHLERKQYTMKENPTWDNFFKWACWLTIAGGYVLICGKNTITVELLNTAWHSSYNAFL